MVAAIMAVEALTCLGDATSTFARLLRSEHGAAPLRMTGAGRLGVAHAYQVEPFKDVAMGNTPPVLKLQENGPEFTGPPRGFAATLSATVGQPLTFPVWVSDMGASEEGRGRGSAPPATLTLQMHRGPGEVKFAEQRPRPDFAAGGNQAQAEVMRPVAQAQAAFDQLPQVRRIGIEDADPVAFTGQRLLFR